MTDLIKISFNPNKVQNHSKLTVVIASDLLKDKVKAQLVETTDIVDNRFQVIVSSNPSINCNTSSVLRLLSRIDSRLYGKDLVERTQIDNWLTIAETGLNDQHIKDLNQSVLQKSDYLVGKQLSLADICVSNLLVKNQTLDSDKYPNIKRWLSVIDNSIKNFSDNKSLSSNNKSSKNQKMTKTAETKKQSVNPKPQKSTTNKSSADDKQEGKYIDLPEAVDGQVVVRFPPEASGYLHIGHAKAALLNQHYAKAYNGKLILRFDDTNPEKEKEDFEKVILEDVKMLQITHDIFSYTSDSFDLILDKCEQLLRSGKAYVDDTAPDVMKTERENRQESKNRNNSVEKNFEMWEEMKKGSEFGQKCCVRAKIDMTSDNGCLRDPAMYRCKNQRHPRTAFKYKVYPTYDFACPIVDSVEGVTHALRTSEYLDRDAQFYWFIDALGLRKPVIWAYSRLNMMNTVLSKRKLTFFVEEGIVEGWDDPRMPTVRGVLRHGLTVDGLKQFIIAQGSSRSVVFMEWDKIWAFNKKVVDPIAARYSAVETTDSVVVNIVDDVSGSIEVALHPKNTELGKRAVSIGKQILIDQTDAQQIKVSDSVTFINWGNLLITGINKDSTTGLVTTIDAKLNLENKDFKKTLKVTWIEANATIPAVLQYFDNIISKPVLKPEDDFKNFINRDTKFEVKALTDGALRNLKKGDIIQIQRKGFFICDSVFDESTVRFAGKPAPIILISIPDGSTDVNIFPKAVQDWKKKNQQLSQTQQSSKSANSSSNLEKLLKDIKDCGDSVRQLKGDKAPKEQIAEKVAQLLKLKQTFKEQSGVEWKPDIQLGQSSPSKPVASKPEPTVENQRAKELDVLVRAQGDEVRKLKAEKATKDVVQQSVNKLLQLKKDFKEVFGKDWTPDIQLSATPVANPEPTVENQKAKELDALVRAQGDEVRKLKAEKAAKDVVQQSVNKLLELKKDFKEVFGKDWTPDIQLSATPVANPEPTVENQKAKELDALVRAQGDEVRKLKAEKAAKDVVQQSVNKLLELKKQFKEVFGSDWTPDIQLSATPVAKPESTVENQRAKELDALVRAQGDEVRKLKAEKAAKDVVQQSVNKLLQLKKDFKEVFGKDWTPDIQLGSTDASNVKQNSVQNSNESKKVREKKSDKQSAKKSEPKAKPKEQSNEPNGKSGAKKQTRLGIETKKNENTADWYTEVITKAEMIEYYDVSGCYILRPWAYAVWESIQSFFDAKIKSLGVENCYFPMFISKAALETEKTHIADFAPEVAWVTKSGQSELAEPIAIRPTSETVMYPSFAKWVQSHRDLPIKLNQWCSVVRWEFKTPTPFLRTREFLWQEGHSAFATKEEALEEVYQILDFYAQIYEYLLAIPVIKGRKTEKEKFAGGDMTTTCEAYVGTNGRGIQGATSHFLGQNFSKMFGIVFEDPNKMKDETKPAEKCFAYQNSWGVSTRSIGAVVMIHGDDKGLVMPPRVAKVQIVIVPCGITATTTEDEKSRLIEGCKQLEQTLKSAGIKVKSDLSDHYSPGWKFNHWELKGVPIRIEFGPKDMQKGEYVAVRRDTGNKISYKISNVVNDSIELLDQIHDNLFQKAKEERDSHLIVTENWKEFQTKLDLKFIILSPFCGQPTCEDQIKKDSAREDVSDASGPLMGAKSLCIPLEQPKPVTDQMKCIRPNCQNKPKFFTLFGRSY